MLIFVFAEVMFMTALVSAFLIIKSGHSVWPPLDQPRLPVESTGFNTFVLLLSGVLLFVANLKFSKDQKSQATKFTTLSMLLGLFFVCAQGYEWIGLIGYGLTMTSSAFGSFFYMIIGIHALHAIGAIVFLSFIVIRMLNKTITAEAFHTSQVFWYFVVGIWPILYALVYLDL